MSMFKKAQRSQTSLKIALTGASGSGKTLSAILLATGFAKKLGSRVAVIDTENRTASLYDDKADFDVCELEPPFTVNKYEAAVKDAIEAGYRVIVIDSISHQWAGEGGMLDRKARLDAGGGNSFAHWAKLTPEQERFRSLILQCNAHLICTMRSKQEYVIEQNERGKAEVAKKGLAPIQREGMEYEFTTVLDIDMAHQAKASKDRTGLFEDFHEKLSQVHGERIHKWWANADAAQAPQMEPVAEAKLPPVKNGPGDLPEELEKKCECGGTMYLHGSRAGYLCRNSKAKGDGHTRFSASELPKFLATEVKTQAG